MEGGIHTPPHLLVKREMIVHLENADINFLIDLRGLGIPTCGPECGVGEGGGGFPISGSEKRNFLIVTSC